MEIKKELDKVNNFLKQKNYNEAKKIYQEILKNKPDIAEIHYNLGLVLKSLNKLDDAEKSIYKAISLKPNFIFAHYQMGNTKFKLKKFEESEICYDKAISLKPDFLEAYINLGRAQRELRKLKQAEDNLRFAQKLNPNIPELNNLLGLILFDRGRLNDQLTNQDLNKLNEAKKIILKAIDSKPNYVEAYHNLGLIYQELGDLDEAKNSFQKSLSIDTNFTSAQYNNNILLNQVKLLNEIGIDFNKKPFSSSIFKKSFNKIPFISKREPNKKLIDLLYKINSTELNLTKGGPLYGTGKTSDYQLFDNGNLILKNLKKDLVEIIEDESKSKVYIMDSFFNILGAGGGSVPHHHLNSFDKTFNLEKQKYSLTYYLSVGDQNCKDPGVFKMYEPEEEILPYDGMIMVIPSYRKHSAIYGGKKDRLMIGVNFYIYG